MNKVYFDYAAATPMSQTVFEAMKPFFIDNFYNPSALYLEAQDVANHISGARSDVARELGCKSSEVIFVAGGTESDNLAIKGVMDNFPDRNLVVSAIEHDAVLMPAKKYHHKLAKVSDKAVIDVADLISKIDDDTVLVSVMYVNNEVGAIQPIREISRAIDDIRQARIAEAERNDTEALPIYLHTDACQAPNYLPILVNTLGIDLMTLNGGKIYGPKQSGILFVRTGVEINAQVLGGGQERGLRSGTESVSSIIGFASALREATKLRESEVVRLEILRDHLIKSLEGFGLIVNGGNKRLANNIHFTVPNGDNERLMMELDERGFMVATGSACSASNDEPSHVLAAMGLSDEAASSSIRLTLGRSSTEADVAKFITELRTLITKF